MPSLHIIICRSRYDPETLCDDPNEGTLAGGITQRTRTSYTEDAVDALALKAEEGRGDRRNVPGELHASEEPGVSEWGNPSRVMSGDRLLNT